MGRRRHPLPPLAERFWSHVEKTDDCWLWTGNRNGPHDQYGVFKIQGKRQGAHRVAWTLTYGSIPNGLMVLHRCDVHLCVRPDHLWLGTAADNSADMVAKGRSLVGVRNPMCGRPAFRGETHPMAKLTLGQVQELRSRYAAGGITQAKLATEYGVHYSTISDIIRRKIWR